MAEKCGMCQHIVVCHPALRIHIWGGHCGGYTVTQVYYSTPRKSPWAAALGTRLQACRCLALLGLLVTEMCSKCGQRRSVGRKGEREVFNHAACPSLEYLPGQFAKHQPVSQTRANHI